MEKHIQEEIAVMIANRLDSQHLLEFNDLLKKNDGNPVHRVPPLNIVPDKSVYKAIGFTTDEPMNKVVDIIKNAPEYDDEGNRVSKTTGTGRFMAGDVIAEVIKDETLTAQCAALLILIYLDLPRPIFHMALGGKMP